MRRYISRPYDSEYKKALYRKSARVRLGFINRSRARRGLPPVDSPDAVNLRVPLDVRN